MGIYLNPGSEAFEKALRSEIYVDKTGLISYTNRILGTEQQNICISRPRRFGKSIAANMLCAYYSRGCDSKKIFSSLKIAKEKNYEAYLNQYNVIFLNIQQFLRKAGSLENLTHHIEEKVLDELKRVYPQWVLTNENSLPNALEVIYANEEREGFVIIIDEWDCIFREAKENQKAQKMYLDFLRDLMKDRNYVKLAYMTGILPIKKYGTHSALNMFDEYSMTNPRGLATYVGFTEEEVQYLCQKYDMDFDESKRWYDGYTFKRAAHIYSPKSVVDAMRYGEFDTYWTRTETYEALKTYIIMNFDGLRDAIVSMIAGAACKIDINSFQNDMTTFHGKDDVLTLLVHLGYLAYNIGKEEVYIPNEEVREEFIRAVKTSGWDIVVKAISQSEALLEDTLHKKENDVAKRIDTIHMQETSILTYNNENALSCVISLAYYSARNYYTLIRELPTGKGFADIVFLPRKKHLDKPAMIVELKWDKAAKGAISQIKKQEYVKSLEEYRGNILLVGINYDKENKKHECVIEEYVGSNVGTPI